MIRLRVRPGRLAKAKAIYKIVLLYYPWALQVYRVYQLINHK